MRAVQNFDPEVLQRFQVFPIAIQIIRPEADLQAGVDEHLHVREDRPRSGIPVELRDVVVDHEEMPAIAAAVAGQENLLAIGIVVGSEHRSPFVDELIAVDRLIGLDADGLIGAVADPLVMDHLGCRRVKRAPPLGSQGEGQVGIIEIGRDVSLVEAADLVPQDFRNGDRRARDVIHILDIVELRQGRVLPAAEIPAAGVTPDDAAGFL